MFSQMVRYLIFFGLFKSTSAEINIKTCLQQNISETRVDFCKSSTTRAWQLYVVYNQKDHGVEGPVDCRCRLTVMSNSSPSVGLYYGSDVGNNTNTYITIGRSDVRNGSLQRGTYDNNTALDLFLKTTPPGRSVLYSLCVRLKVDDNSDQVIKISCENQTIITTTDLSTTTGNSQNSTDPTDERASGKSLPLGLIIGIAVGGAVVVLLVIGIIICVWYRRKRITSQRQAHPSNDKGSTELDGNNIYMTENYMYSSFETATGNDVNNISGPGRHDKPADSTTNSQPETRHEAVSMDVEYAVVMKNRAAPAEKEEELEDMYNHLNEKSTEVETDNIYDKTKKIAETEH